MDSVRAHMMKTQLAGHVDGGKWGIDNTMPATGAPGEPPREEKIELMELIGRGSVRTY